MKAGDKHYMAYVGPPFQYDYMGATQFNLLCTLGLRAEHTLLDFGCGSLRAGRFFIMYLDKNNYYGIEPNKWLIKDAISNQVGKDLLKIKSPHFIYNTNLKIGDIKAKFDYILAQSIFSHMSKDMIIKTLDIFKESLKEAGIAVVTFIEGSIDFEGVGWIYPNCVKYKPETIEAFIIDAGLHLKRIPWYHPRQAWYIITKKIDILPHNSLLKYLHGGILFSEELADSIKT